MTTIELLRDDGHHNKYFHVLPNMYDDDLDPYEYRLIGHYKRVGVSWEGVRKIAKITRMSVGKVTQTRKSLEDKKLVRVEYLTRKELKDRGFDIKEKNPDDKTKIVVTVVIDVMAENIARYQKGVHGENTPLTPVHDMNTPVHHMNTPVHDMNERITIELEPLKNVSKKKRNPNLERWNKVAAIGNELLRVFKNDFVPVENQTFAALEPYLIVAEDLTAIGAPIEHIEPLYKYVAARAERENWNGFTVKALSKYYTDFLKEWNKKNATAARPAPAPEPEVTEAQRAELLEAVRMIRPDWEALKAS